MTGMRLQSTACDYLFGKGHTFVRVASVQPVNAPVQGSSRLLHDTAVKPFVLVANIQPVDALQG